MMNEQISAWLDGELVEGDARRVQGVVTKSGEMQSRCAAMWLIGDVLRDEAPLVPNFTDRVMAALEAEPTVLAPVVVLRDRAPNVTATAPRWMSMAAALAGVAVVAWAALSGLAQQVPVAELASAKPLVQRVALKSSVKMPAQRVDEDRPYLMAHQAYGPGVQMAGVSGYVRPVSLDEPMVAR